MGAEIGSLSSLDNRYNILDPASKYQSMIEIKVH